MLQASKVTVYTFYRLNTTMTEMYACNAFTDYTGRDAHGAMFISAAPLVATISMAITACEFSSSSGAIGSSIGTLVFRDIVEGFSVGFVGRHGVNAVLMHPLLEIESLV